MEELLLKKVVKVLLLCFFMFTLVGCAIKQAQPMTLEEVEKSDPVIIEPTPEQEVIAPSPVYEHAALLTGVPQELENNVRPIAVLINNLKPARPQSGLQEADIIWEVLAEGGITRLVAIFQSTELDELTIGPVRSNRPYFIDIADSYQAVIAHAGASTDAYGILQKQKKPYLDEISNAGPAYWRSKDRKAPHNLYTNLAKLREQMDKKSYHNEASIRGYVFEEEAKPRATSYIISKLDVKFQLDSYKVSYELDEENKQYIRLVNDEQHIDKDTQAILAAKNLVFLQTKHKVLDSEGRLEVDLKSGGDALVIMDGGATEAKWIRAEDGMIRFTVNGEEIKFLPGKTFIHVLPIGKAITEHVTF